LLTVAKLLSLNTDLVRGEVRLIFQTGEETGSGAKKMIASGAVDNVDAMFALHVGNLAGDDNKKGDVIIKEGAVSAGKDKFTITVNGKGTHSAFPERGVDPILISARIVNACEELIAREVPAGTSAVLSFGSISAGVDHNTIPERAVIKGSIRCQDEKIRDFLGKRLTELSKGIAQAFRGDADVELKRGSMTVMNDSDLAKFAYNVVKCVYGDSVHNNTKSALMGSDDFANYANKIPSVYFFLHTNNDKDIYYANHNPKFDVDESVLIKGIVSYLAIVLNCLK
jgi:amidohydrolase